MMLTAPDERPILVPRVWLLLLLDASERSGIAPLSVERLHRVVYLANTLAPVYDLLVPDGYILKYRRGPFFPAVHWDIGRLVAQGLVIASEARAVKDDLGYWISANYRLSRSGMNIVDQTLEVETVQAKALYLREIALAFATLEIERRDDAALVDINYDAVAEDESVNFGDDGRNFAPFAAESLVNQSARSIRRLRLHRYFQYLERAWADRHEAKNAS
jgi:hypothetical protein